MRLIWYSFFYILFAGISSPLFASGLFRDLGLAVYSFFVPTQNVVEVEFPRRAALDNFAIERNPPIPVSIVDIISQYAGELPHFKFPDGVRTFKEMSLDDSILIYRSELKTAVNTGKEPTYLKGILYERAFEIATLIESKETGLNTRGAWIRHVQSIFTVMYAINRTVSSAAQSIARFAASSAARSVAGYAAWSAAWSAASSAAWSAASSAAWSAASSTARSAASSAASSAAGYAAWSAAWKAVRDAVEKELLYLKLKNYEKIGEYAYRIAEKAVLIYFLQHEKKIFEAVYQASSDKLLVPRNHIDIPEAWKASMKKHSAELTSEQYLYLMPYLEAIHRVVAKIPAK